MLHVALDAFRGLLTRAPRLSEDQEIGLSGELVALDRLIDGVGEAKALAARLGSRVEEHDFVLGEADVEVKTTRSERRIHVVHGLGQLTPIPGRLLHPMSMQVTGTGTAGNGETLPELIERIRRRLRSGCTDFDGRLTDRGWEDAQADRLYTTRLLIRSKSRFCTVDGASPTITSAGFSRIVTRPELIRSIDYRIDVTDLKPEGTAPAESAAAPTHKDWNVSIDKYGQVLKRAFDGMSVPMDLHDIVSAYLQTVGEIIVREEVPDLILSAERNTPERTEFHLRLSEWDAEKDAAWTDGTVACTLEQRAVVMKRLGVSDDVASRISKTSPVFVDWTRAILAPDWIPWYDERRRRAHHFCWDGYRSLLEKRLPPRTMANIDSTTTNIVGRLADSSEAEPYQSKGLVVDHVQSGKIANFTGVIVKAIDTGYRFIIVLTGTVGVLRS